MLQRVALQCGGGRCCLLGCKYEERAAVFLPVASRWRGASHISRTTWATLQRIESLEGQHDRQLHVVYLANDILFKAMSQRPAGSGPEAGAQGAQGAHSGGSGGVEQRHALLGSWRMDARPFGCNRTWASLASD